MRKHFESVGECKVRMRTDRKTGKNLIESMIEKLDEAAKVLCAVDWLSHSSG